jgi:hypothetical protein
MNPKGISRLAWVIALATMSLYVLTVFLAESDDPGYFGAIMGPVSFVAFAIVGALILTYRSGHLIGWITLSIGFLFVLGTFASQYAGYALVRHPGSLPGGELLAWMGAGWVASLGWGMMVTFLLLLFPTGRLPSARWKPVAWLTGCVIAALIVVISLQTGSDDPAYPSFRHPLGIQVPFDLLESIGNFIYGLAMIFILLSAASVIVRYKRAGMEERQQIKWFASSAMLLLVTYALTFTINALNFPGRDVVNDLLWALVVCTIPISIGVAILRYRLYDIDLIIRRTLIYTALTLSLALFYAGSVVLLQGVFRSVTGSTKPSQFAIVVSTLAVAALFSPLRRRLQERIDRRFYRRRYDAERVLNDFSASLRDEVDIEQLNERLQRVIQETMQPEHVSIWLKRREQER